MTVDEYDDWRVHSVESFAADLARATGRPLDAARVRAGAPFEELLPQGRDTAGHWLFVVAGEAGESVGTLWNVFGFNDSARRLYESSGYRTTSVQMSKALP